MSYHTHTFIRRTNVRNEYIIYFLFTFFVMMLQAFSLDWPKSIYIIHYITHFPSLICLSSSHLLLVLLNWLVANHNGYTISMGQTDMCLMSFI